MSIKSVKAFVVECDECGNEIEHDEGDYTFIFMSSHEAEEVLNDYEWLVKGKKCYCPDCKPKES